MESCRSASGLKAPWHWKGTEMVMANIAAGMSVKRPGQQQYSSDGYHLTVEMESEVEDAAHFRAAVASLFSEVKQALDAEIANGSAQGEGPAPVDLWSAGGNGGNGKSDEGGNGRKAGARRASSKPASRPKGGDSDADNGSEPATKAQMKYVISLLARSGARTKPEMTSRLSEVLAAEVTDIYALDRTAASRAIEALKGNGKE